MVLTTMHVRTITGTCSTLAEYAVNYVYEGSLIHFRAKAGSAIVSKLTLSVKFADVFQ